MNKSRITLFAVFLVIFATSVNSFSGMAETVPGCVIVSFDHAPDILVQSDASGRLNTGISEIDAILEDSKATSFRTEFGKQFPHLWVVRFDPEVPNQSVIEKFAEIKAVLYAESNQRVPLDEYTIEPNDPRLNQQWHHEAIRMERGWALSPKSEDIVIGIVDTGVDYNHPDLKPAIWVNEAEDLNGNGELDPWDYDFVDNDSNGVVDDVLAYDWVDVVAGAVAPGEDSGPPDNDPADHNGHGTHCAGDAAAVTDNNIGVAAPGWGCKIAALRSGYTAPDGMGYVDLGAAASATGYSIDMNFHVLSMSFGSFGGTPQFFRDVLQEAYDQGIILVGAAGNDGLTDLHYPAALETVIAVASTQDNDRLSGFSNRGDWIDISAPGSRIWSTTPNNGYAAYYGTSMATPIVAGAVAQLRAICPDWTTAEISERLYQTARNFNQPLGGAGILNCGAAFDVYASIDTFYVQNELGDDKIIHDLPADFEVTFSKRDGAIEPLWVRLDSPNERVTFSEDSLYVGIFEAGDDGVFGTEITVARGETTNEMIEIDIIFEGNDELDRFFSYTQTITFEAGHADVLLISAEEVGETFESWYRGALNRIGSGMEFKSYSEFAQNREQL
ncbi:S8 family serine peptidase, partial [bacterium]|nr:S8 family serine peptidase [bacterium]